MGSDIKQRSSMLTKILGAEAAEALEADSAEAMRETRSAVTTPMLDLILRDGTVESFSYAYLSRVRFDPRGRLLLHFGDDIAVIEGRNMAHIREKVRMHKAQRDLRGY